MFGNSRSTLLPVVALILGALLLSRALASEQTNPSIAGGVPFFYYNDLVEAADWYKNKLGLRPVTEEDWVVIFELTDTSFLGLVNATGGSLRPTENKGALLSIETSELEAWYEKLKDVDGINMVHGIEEGANGMIDEFRMIDPGGYIIEFFRWRSHRPEARKYEKNGRGRTFISSGSKWEELAAYSRAVVDGDWIFVSGTVGFDPEDSSIPQDFDQQMDNIFRNISNALAEADADLADIVRVRCFIVDTEYVTAMSEKLHQYLGEVRPANTTVVTQLAAEGALIEVEVTALRRAEE